MIENANADGSVTQSFLLGTTEPEKLKNLFNESIGNHYQHVSCDLRNFPNVKFPKSYIDRVESVLSLMNPVDLSTSGFVELLLDVYNNYTVGEYMSLNVVNNNVVDDYKSEIARDLLSKAIRNADAFGMSLILQNTDEEGDRKFEVFGASNFFYNEEENELFIARNKFVTITENGNTETKDVLEFERRKIVDGKLVISTQLKDGKKTTIVSGAYPANSPEGKLGATIITHNKYATDSVGDSIFMPVMEDIKALEIVIDLSNKGAIYSKPRLHILDEAVPMDENGEPDISALDDDIQVVLNSQLLDDPRSLIEATQFNMNASEFEVKINTTLNIILSKLGLDNKVMAYSNTGGIEMTATEVGSEDSAMFSTIGGRRTLYKTQIIKMLEENIGLSEDEYELVFIPLQFANFARTTDYMGTLIEAGALSHDMAVTILFPKISAKEREAEIMRLKGESLIKKMFEIMLVTPDVDFTEAINSLPITGPYKKTLLAMVSAGTQAAEQRAQFQMDMQSQAQEQNKENSNENKTTNKETK
jgi:hypothetical protein